MVSASYIVTAFHDCFLTCFDTRLVGGADEPLYTPPVDGQSAKIYFRHDYVSSALHEISHWCIAGSDRRRLEDYGYWYESDARDALTQQRFESVEVVPQAVECVLHWSAGLPFRVSVDNLALPDYDANDFARSVNCQVKKYFVVETLPQRARIFAHYLLAQRHPDRNLSGFLQQQYEHNCR